jgi:hypothetical protein
MKTSDVAIIVILVLFFGFSGWLCLFKTDVLVTMGRKNYAKSKFIRGQTFSNIVFKPWYPTFIRGAGIFIWLWAIGFVCFVLAHPH